MKKYLLITSFLFATSFSVSAQWQSIGPHGGVVRCLKANDTCLLAGTRNGVYYLGQGENTWKSLGTGLDGMVVRAICFTDKTVIAGTQNGAFILDVLTGQWEKIKDFGFEYVLSLEVSDSIIYAGSNYDMRKSMDGGLTWESSSPGSSGTSGIRKMGEIIFVGTGGRGMYLSKDKGKSWDYHDPARSQEDYYNGYGKYYYDMGILQGNIFIATERGVYTSKDTGTTWTLTELDYSHSNAFLKYKDQLFVGTDVGLFISDPSGESWSPNNLLDNAVFEKIFSLEYFDGKIYAAALQGIYVSGDDGKSWQEFNVGLSTIDITKVVVSNKVIAAMNFNSLFITADEGNTWRDVTPELDGNTLVGLAMKDNVIFVCTTKNFFTGIYTSADTGKTWVLFRKDDSYSTDVDFTFQDTVMYITCHGYSRYVTRDKGKSWIEWPGNIKYSLGSIFAQEENLFAWTDRIILVSHDFGVSFDTIHDGLNANSKPDEAPFIWRHEIITGCGSFIILGNVIFYPYILDLGHMSWMLMKDSLPSDKVRAACCEGDKIYCCFAEHGVYESSDNGKSWFMIPSDFKEVDFNTMDSSADYIFLCVEDGGLWRYPINKSVKD